MAPPLTRRELEVLRLRADGWSNDEVGAQLSLATHTVKRHLANAYAKLDAHELVDALRAIGWLIVPGDGSVAEIRHERLLWQFHG